MTALSYNAALPQMTLATSSNVAEYLLAKKDPARSVLLFPASTHSYGEVQACAVAFAAFLLDSGANIGDRVILAGENSLFWVAAYLGTMLAGLAVVPLPPDIELADLRHVLDIAGPRFAALDTQFEAKHSSALRHLARVHDRDNGSAAATSFATICRQHQHASVSPFQTDGHHLAALMFTSGSTGKPRGVMISHRNILANTLSITQYMKLTAADRIMTVLPFHYCYGASLLHTHLAVGGSLVVDHRFMFPELILRRMQETRCTGFAGVPSHYQILLRRSALARTSFPSLRYVQQAGGHLAPSLVCELRQALPGTEIFLMYGQTEATARLSYLPPEYLESKPGSIGRGIPGVSLAVLNEAGVSVAPGEVGEIVAQGDNVGCGYWGGAQGDDSFRDGRLYTGDLATIDEEGFIYIVDRAKDFVKCGSKRTSCRSIEEKLLEWPELLEVAVLGIPDANLGEAVQAFLVPREISGDRFAERALAFCKERLQPHLVPRKIVVLDGLPKNSAGKVMKTALKKAALEGTIPTLSRSTR